MYQGADRGLRYLRPTPIQVVFVCADPARLAQFWATALGYKLQNPPEGYTSWPEFLAAQGVPEDEWNAVSAVVDPDGPGPRIYFQRVPEVKTVKNRLHLDLNVGGGQGTPFEERRRRVDAEVERLLAAGATRLGAIGDDGEYFVAMRDPEDNEFDIQ
jgi:catechol 2,3-dioxygenase-like lactoylglutathione lyase family enzyme